MVKLCKDERSIILSFFMSGEIFSGFTNKYEVSKTLRFELKASDRTNQILKEKSIKNEFQELDSGNVDGFFEILEQIIKK